MLANGLALSKIHHAAFDNHLIGIDSDGQVHVSERLLAQEFSWSRLATVERRPCPEQMLAHPGLLPIAVWRSDLVRAGLERRHRDPLLGEVGRGGCYVIATA